MKNFSKDQVTSLSKERTAEARTATGAVKLNRTLIIASNGPAYTDAIARIKVFHKKHKGMAAILPRVYAPGTLWRPAFDPNRKGIEAYSTEEPRELDLKRYGKNLNEGITVTERSFNKCFADALGKMTHRRQMTILLVDGTELVGYVVNTGITEARIYLPKNYLPKGLALPVSGEILPVIAIGYIIG